MEHNTIKMIPVISNSDGFITTNDNPNIHRGYTYLVWDYENDMNPQFAQCEITITFKNVDTDMWVSPQYIADVRINISKN